MSAEEAMSEAQVWVPALNFYRFLLIKVQIRFLHAPDRSAAPLLSIANFFAFMTGPKPQFYGPYDS